MDESLTKTDQTVALVEHGGYSFVAKPGMRIDQMPSTLPKDRAGIVLRMNAQGASTLEMDRSGSLLMSLRDVLCYWREGVNEESGEVIQFSWLVLIDDKGERFGTSSPVVASKVAQVCALWNAELLSRPLPVQIVTRKARKSGRLYHDLILVPIEDNGRGSSDKLDHEPPPTDVDKSRGKKRV